MIFPVSHGKLKTGKNAMPSQVVMNQFASKYKGLSKASLGLLEIVCLMRADENMNDCVIN